MKILSSLNKWKIYWIKETRVNRPKTEYCAIKILMYIQNVIPVLKIMVAGENKWLYNRNLVT